MSNQKRASLKLDYNVRSNQRLVQCGVKGRHGNTYRPSKVVTLVLCKWGTEDGSTQRSGEIKQEEKRREEMGATEQQRKRGRTCT